MTEQPVEPPEIAPPTDSSQPRYTEDWTEGAFGLTGPVNGPSTRAMGAFATVVVLCVTAAGVYGLIDAVRSTGWQPRHMVWILVVCVGLFGMGVLQWRPDSQIIFVKIGPERTTVRYKPARGQRPIDELTEEVIGFLTKARMIGNGSTFITLYMQTKSGDREVNLYHTLFETTLSRPAVNRLNWALARVKREAAIAAAAPREKTEPYRD